MEIIDRVDRLMRGDSSCDVATMEVVSEHWEREIPAVAVDRPRPRRGTCTPDPAVGTNVRLDIGSR